MSATIWSKFYWSDWLSDAGLRRSSLAAKGLWIDMLCIAAQSDPIGYLTVKKVPLSVQDIARMCGGSENEVGNLIIELDQNGVLSRDRNGTIYSRRIVRDDQKSRISQKNGKKGGNPSLCNERVIPAWDNPPDKGRVKPHLPLTTNQKKTRTTYEGEFERFWKVYPSRSGDAAKSPAAKLFSDAVRSGVDPQIVIDAAARYAVAEAKNIGTTFVMQAQKWLRNKRWFDYGPDCAVVKFDVRKHLM